jgi:FixJ family two-component response regulator
MNDPTVFIVDDDLAVRDSLSLLCETAGLHAECFDSAETFLATYRVDQPGCLVLDVRMGGMSGPDLHDVLNRNGSHLPIIYLTGHGDIPMSVRAIKAGAVDFLTKPFNGTQFLDRVQNALRHDCEMVNHHLSMASKCRPLEELTQREREVMELALDGQVSKEIGRHLGISFRTVDVHRAHILQKTGTANLLELAQLVADCKSVLRNNKRTQ